MQRMQNRIIFYDYHAVGMSRPALLSVSSAVGLFCVISSALDSDGDIKCYSLYVNMTLRGGEWSCLRSALLKAGQDTDFRSPKGGLHEFQQNKHRFHFHLTPRRFMREMCVHFVHSPPPKGLCVWKGRG